MIKSENQIICKAQNGDLAAFRKLVMKYDRRVLALALDIMDDPDDAKDVYQEVFISVFKNIKKFKFKSDFFTWLYRITVNKSITFMRKGVAGTSSGKDRYEKLKERSNRSEDFSDDNPEQKLLNKELRDLIWLAVKKLPHKQRIVFTLFHYHGLRINSVAEIMDCSEGTVKNYLFRARLKLRSHIKLHGF
ncbi:MAG: RNA polymerase sigma factor [Fidelibacterota bacterium]